MDYNSSVKWVFGLIKSKPPGKSVHRMGKLMKTLGNPEKKFPSVLVGGSSGKGSTCAILASILRASGYKTGLSTKPHFYDVRERIRINGKAIERKKFSELATTVRNAAYRNHLKITYFEAIKAIAFLCFQNTDISVVEVGMGGRWDSTNVLNPLISIVTNVHLEHTEILGKTKKEIARVKAGIAKSNGVFITSESDKGVTGIFRNECRMKGSRFISAKRVSRKGGKAKITFNKKGFYASFPLLGKHQLQNLSCALSAIEALRSAGFYIPKGSVKRGLANVRWPGRLEVMQTGPLVIVDCAKEPFAAKTLSDEIQKMKGRVICVLSISDDKDIEKIVRNLSASDFFIICRHGVGGRAADPARIAETVSRFRKGSIIIDYVQEAVRE
ncbi:MAG: hypothetical protein HZB68_02625, partial [Candidatus Aenigmarchaeota archaeon]|nr:hypothetical protein [Candidatus Aenigmarchaeota archaeon]